MQNSSISRPEKLEKEYYECKYDQQIKKSSLRGC